MATIVSSQCLVKIFLLICVFQLSFATRRLNELVQDQSQLLHYHNGPLLSDKISINLILYGHFKPSQKAIISDFNTSLSTTPSQSSQPSFATWRKTIEKFYYNLGNKVSSPLSLSLGKQILDNYSLGKSLTSKQLVELASKGDQKNVINVVLTSADVAVEGFSMSRCGTHGSSSVGHVKGENNMFAYIWVGNSKKVCLWDPHPCHCLPLV